MFESEVLLDKFQKADRLFQNARSLYLRTPSNHPQKQARKDKTSKAYDKKVAAFRALKAYEESQA